jgi:hypothetical protein
MWDVPSMVTHAIQTEVIIKGFPQTLVILAPLLENNYILDILMVVMSLKPLSFVWKPV